MGIVEVDGWPQKPKMKLKPRQPKPEYLVALKELQEKPANKVYVVRGCPTPTEAQNWATWLKGRSGIEARTTRQPDQLLRYGYPPERIADIVAKAQANGMTVKPEEFTLVLAMYSPAEPRRPVDVGEQQ